MLDYHFVDGTRLVAVIEALIFSSPDPLSWEKISAIINENEEELHLDERVITTMVGQLNERYEANDLAFRIEEIGGGFVFVTQPRFHPWLSIYQYENAYRRLSQPAIETLAIVAYRQPVTKPEVDQIRGVDSGYVLRQLLEKMLVKVSGRADSPGKPLLYKTTDYFLKHFGLNAIDELPKPREIDEILKDDDMAEHRQLLMERQMELDEDQAKKLFEEYTDEVEDDQPLDHQQNGEEESESDSENDNTDKTEDS